ncbi:MAG TPA: propionyl-CoA synthetase [Pseudomonadales bacterium]|jgi:propionyl-CoA synthetase|nr:propionyl-CoA synthetase [Pseudomonadales bacterium]MDP6316411.1 propionyl-CoA synthetase [Pseudomonadales bacterium]MDP7315001.1 propionyl-CoA synthetase [Pseudomonadales bacterium]HJL61618.1 propionyl-CoA synthetase [Pseudomonadales bacterium]HJP51407.1 propionyl-CoA synthetase [Pseudomonadales bacterium]|tara:strand:+ start:2823 stop:4727 length:1905 start_codon:yes stop_codon:yes gene_type:complete
MKYLEQYELSISNPDAFWRDQAGLIEWFKFPESILSKDHNDNSAWFADGELNTSYLALDYHVDHGRADQIALIYDSPVTNTVQKFSYLELRDEVALFAGALCKLGVTKGDRVIIYMPMIPEAVIAMLACARIGAIHCVVFGGFAAKELATRIDDSKPKLILTASCGIEFSNVIAYKPLIDEAQSIASHAVDYCVIHQRPECKAEMGPDDIDWQDALVDAEPADCVTMQSCDALYILYTSGTTGKPKGVVRENGGHAVALRYSMQAVYDVKPGDVYWAASDVGWVVGHSYIVYAPLITGCTTVLFEGKPVRTPDAGTFWRVISDHQVDVLFTAPTAFRAIRKEDPDSECLARYDISCLRTLFVAGERTEPSTYHWLEKILRIPVVDHWWQTETGWPIASNMMGIEVRPTKPGSATFPVPGFNVQILSSDHEPLTANKEGDVVIKLPLPPSSLPTVWDDHERYLKSYLSQHEGYYHTGDGGYFDEDGYLFIMGRTDDVINVAGHRLSTGEMEEIVASHSAVAECVVIGIEDPDKGQVPVGLTLLMDGTNVSAEELQDELVALVRKEIGAFANFRRSIVVPRLPKTRSGKILRQVMRKIADNKPFEPPATIDDLGILDEVRDRLVANGIGLVSEGEI